MPYKHLDKYLKNKGLQEKEFDNRAEGGKA